MTLFCGKKVTCDQDLLDLQCDVDHLVEGIESRDLRLNVGKTKCLVISRKRKPSKPRIEVHGEVLDQVSSFKYLGVIIDEKLSWKLQIAQVSCKAKRLLGYLYRNIKLADRKWLVHLYKSLVVPILDYCSSVWDPHQSGQIKMVEGVQSFAARLVTGKWQERSEKLCEELGWSPLSVRRSFQKLCLCWQILNSGSLIPTSVFVKNNSQQSRNVNTHSLKRPLA